MTPIERQILRNQLFIMKSIEINERNKDLKDKICNDTFELLKPTKKETIGMPKEDEPVCSVCDFTKERCTCEKFGFVLEEEEK